LVKEGHGSKTRTAWSEAVREWLRKPAEGSARVHGKRPLSYISSAVLACWDSNRLMSKPRLQTATNRLIKIDNLRSRFNHLRNVFMGTPLH
jgi:hypothetical protein